MSRRLVLPLVQSVGCIEHCKRSQSLLVFTNTRDSAGTSRQGGGTSAYTDRALSCTLTVSLPSAIVRSDSATLRGPAGVYVHSVRGGGGSLCNSLRGDRSAIDQTVRQRRVSRISSCRRVTASSCSLGKTALYCSSLNLNPH